MCASRPASTSCTEPDVLTTTCKYYECGFKLIIITIIIIMVGRKRELCKVAVQRDNKQKQKEAFADTPHIFSQPTLLKYVTQWLKNEMQQMCESQRIEIDMRNISWIYDPESGGSPSLSTCLVSKGTIIGDAPTKRPTCDRQFCEHTLDFLSRLTCPKSVQMKTDIFKLDKGPSLIVVPLETQHCHSVLITKGSETLWI